MMLMYKAHLTFYVYILIVFLVNPDEYLNCDLKTGFHSGQPARDKNQLCQKALSHLRKLQKLPQRVMKYFKHPKLMFIYLVAGLISEIFIQFHTCVRLFDYYTIGFKIRLFRLAMLSVAVYFFLYGPCLACWFQPSVCALLKPAERFLGSI